MLKREESNVLKEALNFETKVRREKGRPKSTSKEKVEEETKKIGLSKEDATNPVR